MSEEHQAIQYTLRVATRDKWSRSDITEILEMLGLVPSPQEVAPERTPLTGSGRHQRDWCRRDLHRMSQENTYVAPNGDRGCRKCKQAQRAGCDPAVMHPAEVGAPSLKFITTGELMCRRGLHVLDGKNVITTKRGRRECRECRNWRNRQTRARRRAERDLEEAT